MVKKFYALLFAIWLLLPLAGSSQTLDYYAFQAGTSTYTPISQGTSVGIYDDDDYATIALPFAFTFAETTYQQGASLYVCSNGYLTLGDSDDSVWPDETSYYSFISPFGHDLDPSSDGTITYSVTGSTPNRVLTVQWAGVPCFGDDNTYNFQVKIYETTNAIEFCYGQMSITEEKSPVVGLYDHINTEKLIVTGTGNWANFTTSSTVTDLFVDINTGSYPASGLTYSFTPATITCPRVNNLAAFNYGPNSFDLSWQPGGTETSWNVTYLVQGDSTTLVSTTTSTPNYTVSGLTPNTRYAVSVSAICAGDEESLERTLTAVTLFTTPASLPYVCGFEDQTENSNWTLVNNPATNVWSIGSATCAGTSGNSLYVSNDNGTTNAYNKNAASTVFAVRDITLDTAARYYALSFDYKGIGETNTDYLKVWLAKDYPAQVTANNLGTGTDVEGATYVAVNGSQYLGRSENWTHVNHILQRTDGWGDNGLLRIYLMWRNNNVDGSNPPAAIDNIAVKGYTCAMPQNLAANDSVATQTAITVTWNKGAATDAEWQACICQIGENPDMATPVTVTDTTHQFTGLNASTSYTIYVRTVCGTETSAWASVNASTACSAYMTIPYAESFDNYGTGTPKFPSCWTRSHTTSSTYPFITNSAPSSGIGCLYFYSSYSGYSAAIAPQIDTNTTPINTLMVSFKVKKNSSSSGYGALQLGVMSDPADFNTFQVVKTWATTDWAATNTWYSVEELLSGFTGNGSYIALRKPTGSGYTYVDDFAVSLIPTCLKPAAVTLSAITANNALADWTPQGTETEWEVVVVPTGTSPDAAVATSTSAHPFTVTGLDPNTAYDIYVKAICASDDQSLWSDVVTFQTRCQSTDVIPYTENFDTYGTGNTAFPSCWSKLTNTTSATRYPYIEGIVDATDTANAGALYFYASSATYSLAASQALDLSAHTAGTLLLTFKAKKVSNSYGRLDIGVMTDPDDLNTLTVLKTIYPNDYVSPGEWQTFYVPFNQAFNNVYLAFYSPTGSTSYCHVDNVRLDYMPECFAPSNLTVSNISGRSALLSWTAAVQGNPDYTVEYSEAGQDNWQTASSTVSDTRYLLGGLEPQTTYDVRVSSSCASSAGSTETITAQFTTGCASSTAFTVNNGTQSMYNGIPVNNFYNFTYTQQIFDAAELGGAMSISSIAFDYAYATPMSEKDNVTIYLAHTSQSVFSTTSSWVPIDSATVVYTGTMNFEYGWNTVPLTTPFQYNGTSNLVLIVDDNSGSYNNGSHVFNVHSTTGDKTLLYKSDTSNPDPTAPPTGTFLSKRNNIKFMSCNSTATCVAPNVIVTASDNNSVTIAWVPGNAETQWQLEYMLETDSVWTSEGTVTASPYTITNLVSDADYIIRLRSNCGTENSAYSLVNASTTCASIATLPYTENFDSATGTGAGNFISCWYSGTNGSSAYPYTSNSDAVSASYSLYFMGSSTTYSYAATPRFANTIAMNNLQVSFSAKKTSANYFIEVGVMTDPTDITTFQPIGRFSPAQNNSWELCEMNTSNYTGNGRHIAFRTPQWISNFIYIDDVTVQEIPFCGRVEDIAATNITTDAATITWTPGSNETQWEVCYGITGTVDPTTATPVAVSADTVALSGLTSNTAYDVYVRIVCDGGDYGAWTKFTFRTDCGISSVPYIENFDSYTNGIGSSTTVPDNYPNVDMPSCWTFLNRSEAASGYPTVFLTTASGYASSGKALFFKSSSTTSVVAALPVFNVDINTLQITFKYRNESTYATNGTLEVGYITNLNDPSTFTAIYSCPRVTTLTEVEQPLSSVPALGAGNSYIAFRYVGGTSNNYYLSIDDVAVEALPSCTKPSNLAVSNVTSSSVELSWTENGTATAWNIEYGPQGFTQGTGTTVAATTNPFAVTGLTDSTAYDFYVQADCGAGETSEWRGVVTATPGSFLMPTSGSTTITLCDGIIYDDGGANSSYSPSCEATLVINPETAGNMVKVQGVGDYTFESCCDYLIIYDGSDNTGTQLFSTQNTSSGTIPECVSTTGPITLYVHSDGSVQYSGFALQVSCVDTTGGEPDPGPTPPDPEPQPADTCHAPANLTVADITMNSANLSWTQQGEPDSWNVYFRKGTDAWTTVNTTTPSPYALTDLMPESNYEAYVVAVCDDTVSAASNTITFSTLPDAIEDYVLSQTKLYPNPTSSSVTIVNDNCMIEKVEVYDVYGQTLRVQQVSSNSVVLPADELAAGMYFVRIITDKGTVVKPFTKR